MIISAINAEIAKRTQYGYRVEIADHPGWVISWSNASATWYLAHYVRKHGLHLKLDANQIFVSAPKEQIENILEELDPLPLYANSYEGSH